MRPTRQPLRCILLLSACLATAAAHADISKCIDQAGRITYSDGSCGDAEIIGHLDVVAPDVVVADEAPAPRKSARTSLDNLPLHETAWATLPIAPRRASTDAATIQAAHEALAMTDRGVAAIRTQKLASSR